MESFIHLWVCENKYLWIYITENILGFPNCEVEVFSKTTCQKFTAVRYLIRFYLHYLIKEIRIFLFTFKYMRIPKKVRKKQKNTGLKQIN